MSRFVIGMYYKNFYARHFLSLMSKIEFCLAVTIQRLFMLKYRKESIQILQGGERDEEAVYFGYDNAVCISDRGRVQAAWKLLA